jgi:hypothetical protein
MVCSSQQLHPSHSAINTLSYWLIKRQWSFLVLLACQKKKGIWSTFRSFLLCRYCQLKNRGGGYEKYLSAEGFHRLRTMISHGLHSNHLYTEHNSVPPTMNQSQVTICVVTYNLNKTFTATTFNKIFWGWQPRSGGWMARNQSFEDHLFLPGDKNSDGPRNSGLLATQLPDAASSPTAFYWIRSVFLHAQQLRTAPTLVSFFTLFLLRINSDGFSDITDSFRPWR